MLVGVLSGSQYDLFLFMFVESPTVGIDKVLGYVSGWLEGIAGPTVTIRLHHVPETGT